MNQKAVKPPVPPYPIYKYPDTLTPFRYFCQRVLPSVYGDELSYYELLCKVTDYLNKTMENVNELNEDVKLMEDYINVFTTWINNYFENLDVQEEINNKLDALVTSGALSDIFNEFLNDKTKQIDEALNNNTSQIINGLESGFVDVEKRLREELIDNINGMPIFIDNISEAIDTQKLYVLKSNNHIYQYKNGEWQDTGVVYPQTVISDGYITPNMTTFAEQKTLNAPLSLLQGFRADPATNLYIADNNVKELSVFKFEEAGNHFILWFPNTSPQGAFVGISNQEPGEGVAAIKAYALPPSSQQWNKTAYGYVIETTAPNQYVSIVTKYLNNSAKVFSIPEVLGTTDFSINDIKFVGLGETFTGSNFKTRSITPDKLSFAEQYGNLMLTATKIFPGYYSIENRTEPIPDIILNDITGASFMSAIIPAKPNTTYKASSYYLTELDENFNIIQCAIYTTPLLTTDKCAYVVGTYKSNATPSTTVVWTGDTRPENNYGGWNFEQSETVEKYLNKNVLTLGDSITAYGPSSIYGWQKYFNDIVKTARIDNIAVDGCHWKDYNDNTVYDGNPVPDNFEQNVMGNQVQKIINNRSNYLADYDMIFLACGTNDRENQIPTYADIEAQYYNASGEQISLDQVKRNTWTGAFRWVYENLRALFPTAKICIMTPIQRYGITMFQHVDTLRNIQDLLSKRISVECIDMLECGVYGASYNGTSNSGDFQDGLHPNEKGARKMGYFVAQNFIEYFNNNGR